MTDTMTADRTTTDEQEWDLNPGPTQNVPAIAAVPSDQDEFRLAVRRMLGLEDASDGEIDLFFHVCHKSGLDPFNKEVYMIGRNTEVAHYEPVNPDEPDGQKRKVMRWVTKYTIQTAINGFRKRAREIADSKGITYTQDAPLWCGEDGQWREVWTERKANPVAAKFTVYRDGEAYPFIAHFDEYVQTNRNGEPNSMWGKMKCNQIRKCAEAGAIQAAFPDELGGLLLEDAVQEPHVITVDTDGQVVDEQKPRTRRGGRGTGGLRDRAKAAEADNVVEGEVVEPPADPPALSKTRQKLNAELFRFIGAVDLNGDAKRPDRLIALTAILDRDELLTTSNDLSDDEVRHIIKEFKSFGDAEAATTVVTTMIGEWKQDQAQAAAPADGKDEFHADTTQNPGDTEAADNTQEKLL